MRCRQGFGGRARPPPTGTGRSPDLGIPEISIEPRVLFNPQLRSAIFLVPGVLALVLAVITMMLTAMGLTREKAESGGRREGDAGPESDVDLLVKMEEGRSLLDLSAMILDLKELLGVKVDVVSEDGLYWLLRRRILKEARPL